MTLMDKGIVSRRLQEMSERPIGLITITDAQNLVDGLAQLDQSIEWVRENYEFWRNYLEIRVKARYREIQCEVKRNYENN